MWGRSPEMLQVFARLREIALTDTTVIVEGETGTGKELVAEAIHEHSPRADAPYVVVDCAAVAAELIESELFGHVRGAFTGAVSDRTGAFEAANQGTIFIDEIGELPLLLQPKLLRVLERQEVKRVGANVTRSIDVRVIAATNRNLEREVAEGRFREDLYFRLNVVKVKIPALRERKEDILFLADQFLREMPTAGGKPLELRPDARERLASYAWPGNVRELRNIIDRGAAMSDAYFRVPEELGIRGAGMGEPDPSEESENFEATAPAERGRSRDGERGSDAGDTSCTRALWRGKSYKDAKAAVMADFERGYITALLEAHEGNVSAAARAAGIHRNILHRMMARYGIGRYMT